MTFADAAHATIDILGRYIDESRSGEPPVVPADAPETLSSRMRLEELVGQGGLEHKLDAFIRTYLTGTTRLHHPGYIAHQVSVPAPLTALADLLHGVTNNPMAIYEMGPAAAAVELFVVEWMLKRAGWSPRGAGVLMHGGSLANLVALLAARAAIAPEAWETGNPDDLVVLAPEAAHYSIARAASIIGLGRERLRLVPVDEMDRMVPAALRSGLDAMRSEGRRVMAVVANACVTSTGAFDPLPQVADICREAGVWLHVDGAHGATALLSRKHRHRLSGLEHAHSLTWDAHKMLRVPTLCTALLVRDRAALESTFSEQATYLFYGDGGAGPDLIHRTIECTKAGLGLKLLFALAAEGEGALEKYWDERCAAASRFVGIVRSTPGFECPFEPESNIVCFRWSGSNEEQVRVRDSLLRAGRFHISSTEVHGTRYLRLAVMNPLTSDDTVRELLEAIRRVTDRELPPRRVQSRQ